MAGVRPSCTHSKLSERNVEFVVDYENSREAYFEVMHSLLDGFTTQVHKCCWFNDNDPCGTKGFARIEAGKIFLLYPSVKPFGSSKRVNAGKADVVACHFVLIADVT